ncbi:hypothetical protein JRI60_04225 [Archangium violaceum]|uniref:hypothetical protein n=1 Tax=Archangium violaceum TaxID=83451 RepID=UPI00194FE2CE|nr:hypothetical protein [Archangium violaceum]QRN98284.1 hypothetical protein JRI60_04225 [Archangium violaceum]
MRRTAKIGLVRLLLLLALCQVGCLAESDSAEVAGRCGPRDLTPECCLKQFPGQWERCTGSPEMARAAEAAEATGAVGRTPSLTLKATAAGLIASMAGQTVRIGSAEQRGTELAADLLAKVEAAIVRCVRRADQQVNDYHFHGESPDWDICQQVNVGERTTWAAYLGLFKHEQAWPCLREALDKLLPRKNHRLRPRFYVDPTTGRWEHMPEEMMSQILSREGWSGLKGTIEPDIVILDENGFIVHVYDLKFPCPESNAALWERYMDGRWRDRFQGDVYEEALGVEPLLVSPRWGVSIPRDK